MIFQSTLPVWGATEGDKLSASLTVFQSTLPVWGATHNAHVVCQEVYNFNPRSPCGERRWGLLQLYQEVDISIHAPRVGSDKPLPVEDGYIILFQSTLPVWGATSPVVEPPPKGLFQSTLPVWGATGSVAQLTKEGEFQSTLPVWGATVLQRLQSPRYRNFNPRSPCGERRLRRRFRWRWVNFNPRSPCGERLLLRDQGVPGEAFQSTLPVWGATTCWLHRPFIQVISIHAPRVGSDLNAIPNGIFPPEFQSTLPVWGATAYTPLLANGRTDFNPRSPCGERHPLPQTRTTRW